jgi:hypothetical protein
VIANASPDATRSAATRATETYRDTVGGFYGRCDVPLHFWRHARTAILSEMKRQVTRHADPYRDTQLVDERAPRTNQLVVGVLAAVAVLVGPWWLLAILALQLALGLTLGRRWCLACVAYFELIQPWLGEGRLEDSRPPRFANMVGLGFLSAASLAFLVGLDTLGTVLGSLVAVLALLAAATGFCAGCTAYKVGYRLTGRTFVSCPLPPTLG